VSLMFVNSIENGIVDIDITVIEMDVLFKCLENMESFQCVEVFAFSFNFYDIHRVLHIPI
jgi:hypothetical protein